MIKQLVFVITMSVASGCFHSYTPVSPGQLSALGTRHYPGTTPDHALQACATALGTLGYRVTVADPTTGIVKTAPAPMGSSATGGPGYANMVDDGLSWSIVVERSTDGTTVRATPRGFRNGTEVHDDNMWVHEIMDAKFNDLWTEIDAAVKASPPAAPVVNPTA